MKEYIKIVTKEGPVESTIDVGNLINKRVVSLKGFVVGRVKKVKINNIVNKPTKVLIKNIKRKSPDDELESNIKNSMRGLSDIFRRK